MCLCVYLLKCDNDNDNEAQLGGVCSIEKLIYTAVITLNSLMTLYTSSHIYRLHIKHVLHIKSIYISSTAEGRRRTDGNREQ